MELKKIKISELKKAGYNPRKISPEELEKLKNSIKKFGYVEPIIMNQRTGNIVAGHQRLQALEALKHEQVDVITIDIPENDEKALNIALNKIRGDWDEQKLTELLGQIENDQEELLSFTGFGEKEIAALLERVKDQFEYGKEDTLNINQITETKVQKGDIFSIDNHHKIICGDSTDPSSFSKVLGAGKIDLVVSSPPYNIGLKYRSYEDNKEFTEYMDTMKKVYRNCKEFMNKDRYICINIGDQQKANLAAWHSITLEQLKFVFHRSIYWKKPDGSSPAHKRIPYPRWLQLSVPTESVEIYFNPTMEEQPEWLDVMMVYSDREIERKNRPATREATPLQAEMLKKYWTNVWNLIPEVRGETAPGVLCLSLPVNCITFYSLDNELVLDPFTGAGTTLMAAQQKGRKFAGIELDPRYVELVLRRYQKAYPNSVIKCMNREVKL